MEWLLLLLLGGLTAGVGVWAATGKKEEKRPFADLEEGDGPRSSPDLPSSRRTLEERGKPVVVGEGTRQLKELLDRAPASVQGRVTEKEAQGRPGRPRKPLKIPHMTDQVIPRASKFAHHRRSLLNAEALAEKQKAKEALEIYERIKNRIVDDDIRVLLNENIEAIKKWMAGLDEEEGESLQFPEIIIPLTTQAIAIANLTEGLREISKGVVGQLSQAFSQSTTVALPGATGELPAPSALSGAPSGLPQIIAVPLPTPGGGTGIPGGAPGVSGSTPGVSSAPGTAPSAAPSSPSAGGISAAGMAAGAGIAPPFAAPAAYAGPVAPAPATGEAVPVGKAGAALPAQLELEPGLEVADTGEVRTDGWTDADFEREWEKYKNLPLKDRRSGKERRTGRERRTGADAVRKDRRGGQDRRKKDLFKERDDFLKKLEEHKRRKKEAEEAAKKKAEAARKAVPLKAAPLPAPAPVPVPTPAAPAAEKGDEAVIRIEKATIKIGEDLKPEVAEKPETPALMQLAPPEPLDVIGLPAAEEQYFEKPAEAAEETGMSEIPGLAPPPKAEEAAAPGSAEASAAEPGAGEGVEEADEIPEIEPEEKKPPVQEIHGILELKPPEEDDAPFLTLTYDFAKIPDSFKLSRDYHTMEYAYYKYKPMLIKAQEFSRRKMLKNALNYYRVIKSQNIPPEFKRMINRNIKDITEYLEKFLMSRG